MERYIQAVLPLEYTGILDDIPLEECIEERELVSGKRAYRAPVGKAFRIEGAFTIWYDSSSVELQYAPPQDSKEAFMSGTDYGILADDLDQYLDAVNGDRKQAVRLFEEAGGALPEYFIGKWLIMGVNETGEAVIIVREQIQARIVEETGYGALFPDDETVIFEAKDLQVEWQQRYVEIAQGTDNARLSFVDENESLEFVIPPMPKLSRELIVPWRDGGLRSDSYFLGGEN